MPSITTTTLSFLWFLFLVPTFSFAPTPTRAIVTKTKPLLAHRNVIVLSHNVSETVADGRFDVNTLLTGRVDVLARCVNAALWVSHGIRRDTTIFLMLFPQNLTVEIRGEDVKGLNPDERTMALYLQRTLLVGSSADRKRSHANSTVTEKKDSDRPLIVNPHKPGSRSKSEKKALRTERKAREAMLRRIRKSTNETTFPQGFALHRDDSLIERMASLEKEGALLSSILMFEESGDTLWDVMEGEDFQQRRDEGGTTTLILGDQIGYAPCDNEYLAGQATVTRVSLGPLSLLTSQCIAITHHYLDRQGDR
uniref:Uncharacterized protein n=1 Tax=Ditylum brightwellii TaxID=49249 RepID=A0A7S4R7K0_9STRA|mmetsp:Transcript_6165/g.8094  ORF Transcript_6165/g.8094 Transcript_6165/m.8094 type:complete len:309 (+) Transcript_6165:18-944(+)